MVPACCVANTSPSLRRPGDQRLTSRSSCRGASAGAAGRERRGQVDWCPSCSGHYGVADGHIGSSGRPACRQAARCGASTPASAWCTSTSRWPTTWSVLDNVMLGTRALVATVVGPRDGGARLLATAQRPGLPVAAPALVGSLSVGERQRVEILRRWCEGRESSSSTSPPRCHATREAGTCSPPGPDGGRRALSSSSSSHKLAGGCCACPDHYRGAARRAAGGTGPRGDAARLALGWWAIRSKTARRAGSPRGASRCASSSV